jgi:glyoxylase-like metal-dependent hydrolase (beta-lactamase superfamily II)
VRVGVWDATLIELARYPIPPGLDTLGPTEWGGDRLEMALNVLVLRSSQQLVLVDAGTGLLDDWLPQFGRIAHPDVDPDEVDLVISTHLDPDHAGGLVAGTWPDDLRPAFPNARVVAFAPELRRYRERDPAAPRNAGTPVVAALERAGVLEAIDDDREVAPGVHVRLAAGHSPGHAIVEVAGDPGLVFVTDTVHTVAIVAQPELGLADQDVPTALATRRRVLGELADRGVPAWAAHIPGPEPARVERAGDGFRWR